MNESQPTDLFLYVTETGKVPFKEWLEKLQDKKARAKIRVRLDRLNLGLFGDCKSVGDGVQELRIDWGPGYRAYFCFDGQRIIVLLLGGDKGSQSKDIARAKQYRQNYEERKNEALQEL
jgi:putative addiction module killer protein